MGTEKSLLTVQGKTLIDHAIAQARSVSEDVFICGSKDLFSAYGRVVADVYTGCGPLGGIHAALTRSQTDLNLMLAVDTPFITKEFLAYLVQEAQRSGAMVTVPATEKGRQPLCAIYRKGFLAAAEAALKTGTYKLDALFPTESTCAIDFSSDAVKALGFDAAMFDNLNTREDYERVKRRKTKTANPQ
jgi:molybdenum cofactor guanylyltransferase